MWDKCPVCSEMCFTTHLWGLSGSPVDIKVVGFSPLWFTLKERCQAVLKMREKKTIIDYYVIFPHKNKYTFLLSFKFMVILSYGTYYNWPFLVSHIITHKQGNHLLNPAEFYCDLLKVPASTPCLFTTGKRLGPCRIVKTFSAELFNRQETTSGCRAARRRLTRIRKFAFYQSP